MQALISRQIGQHVPVRLINLNGIECLDSEFIYELLDSKYPAQHKYQIQFLKKLFEHYTSLEIEMSDNLYKKLASLMQNPSPDSFYKTYYLPLSHIQVFIREDYCIQYGTTGLSTWGASLFLLEFLWLNKQLLYSKRVIELGSGCGFLGIACANYCESIILTDSNHLVIERLQHNIDINRVSATSQILDWRDSTDSYSDSSETAENHTSNYDLVITADVIFDPALVHDLACTIKKLLHAPHAICLVSYTVRNQSTSDKFIHSLNILGLEHEKVGPIRPSWYHYDENSQIEILKIKT